MKMKVEVAGFSAVYTLEDWFYPGGEIGFRIPNFSENQKYAESVEVHANINNSDELIKLILLNEIIDRELSNTTFKILYIPYFPYARQDRVTRHNEPFSLKSITKLINDLNFDGVIILDPHSDVTCALINNVRVVKQHNIIQKFIALSSFIYNKSNNVILVSPDAGADKKVVESVKIFNKPMISCGKVRDVVTGNILDSKIYANKEDVEGKDILILDDICDGGKTFVELGKKFREMNPKSVNLYITHGIFSKGFEVFKDIIDRIFTTNSFTEKTDSFNIKELHYYDVMEVI